MNFKTTALTAIPALILSTSVNAALITVSPDSVNRIIGSVGQNAHYTDYFSTQNSGPQSTLLQLSTASLLAALEAQLGVAANYTINSATLTVGAITDNYAAAGDKNVYTVLTAWDANTVTWNTAGAGSWNAPGLTSGIDYSAIAADTGAVLGNGYQTQWTGLGSTLQSWLDGATVNNGLFFAYSGSVLDFEEYTAASNVTWTIDATVSAVPVPAAAWLFGSGLLGLVGVARRKNS